MVAFVLPDAKAAFVPVQCDHLRRIKFITHDKLRQGKTRAKSCAIKGCVRQLRTSIAALNICAIKVAFIAGIELVRDWEAICNTTI